MIFLEKEVKWKVKRIHWNISDYCNRRCYYCHQSIDRKENLQLCWNNNLNYYSYSNVMAKLVASNLYKLYDIPVLGLNKNEACNIEFSVTGGEPSLFNLPFLVDISRLKLKNFLVITNFLKPLDYYIDLYKSFQSRNIHLYYVLSYHEDYISVQKFFDKVDKLSSIINEIPSVVFVLDNTNYKDLDYIINNRYNLNDKSKFEDNSNFLRNHFRINIRQIPEKGTDGHLILLNKESELLLNEYNNLNYYTNKVPETFKAYDDGKFIGIVPGLMLRNQQLLEQNNFSFKGSKCYITSDYIDIGSNGDIGVSSCMKKGIYGNLITDTIFKDINLIQTCDKNFCRKFMTNKIELVGKTYKDIKFLLKEEI